MQGDEEEREEDAHVLVEAVHEVLTVVGHALLEVRVGAPDDLGPTKDEVVYLLVVVELGARLACRVGPVDAVEAGDEDRGRARVAHDDGASAALDGDRERLEEPVGAVLLALVDLLAPLALLLALLGLDLLDRRHGG